MANDNRLWGAERIRGELLKLGLRVSKRSIQKYLAKLPRTAGQSWSTFLKHHAADIWACDFTIACDLLFRPLYIFVIMELRTRKLLHAAVTTSPTDDWTAQQLRQATPWGKAPRYLIRDRDTKYGRRFSAVAASSGIRELKTPYRAPRANAFCERLAGSLKRECLDYISVLNSRQLQPHGREFVRFYNHSRPHQGIDQRIPAHFARDHLPTCGTITSVPVLGGLHHSYVRVA
jgi:putative transposase